MAHTPSMLGLALLALLATGGAPASAQLQLPAWLRLRLGLAARKGPASEPNADFEPPSWYHGRDGPIFQVMQSTADDVELRHYQPTKWVSTNITNTKFDEALKQGSKRLDDYWNGGNTPETKVDNTVPTFVVFTYPKDGPDRTIDTTKYQVEYFLPHELHDSPPPPKARDVGIINVPEVQVWVKIFGGYAKEQDIVNQAFSFRDDLKQQGIKVVEGTFGLALYDDPLRLVNRHNEIWFWTEQAPSAKKAKKAQKPERVETR